MADKIPLMASHEAEKPLEVNYQALYDMQMSSDPRMKELASKAAKNLSWDEQQQWFNFQQEQHQSQGHGGTGDAFLGVGNFKFNPEDVIGGMLGAGKVGLSKVAPAAGQGMIDIAKLAGLMYAINKGGEALGAPKDVINMLMLATGLKGGPVGRAGAGAAAAEEGAIAGAAKSRVTPAMSDAEYLATYGKPRMGTPGSVNKLPNGIGSSGGSSNGASPSNLERLGPGSGASEDQVGEMISREVHGGVRGKTALGLSPRSAKSPEDILENSSRVLQPSRSPFDAGGPAYPNPGVTRRSPSALGENPPGFRAGQSSEKWLQDRIKEIEGTYGQDPSEVDRLRQLLKTMLDRKR